MNLSPLDIRRQQFTKAFRGYDPTEVDAFLKQVSDQVEHSQEEVRRAEERVRDAEAKLVHYEKVELALQEALESARDTARKAEASAEEHARLIVEAAELKAQQIVHDAERERYGLRHDVAKLSSRQAEVAARLRGFLLSELEILAQFQGDDPVGFIKLQSAEARGTLPPAPPPQIEVADDTAASAPEPAPEAASEPGGAPEPEAPEAETVPAAEPGPTEPAEDEAPESSPTAAAFDADDHVPAWPASASPAPEAASGPEDAPGPEEPARPTPPAVTGGWDLRSLVTGEERNVAASEAERERIRKILEDLD